MARPSPRTQGVDEEGKTFPKFGTQQLRFVNQTPPKLGTSYQGVRQLDTGYNQRIVSQNLFKGFVTSNLNPFGTPIQRNYTVAPSVGVYNPPPQTATPNGEQTIQNGECHLDDNKPFCGFTELIGGEKCECPNWFTGEVTPTDPARGCECEACKNGTGQCDTSVPECDAWDLGCIATGGKVEETFNWIKIVLILIGIGIFLWLLRPLLGIAKNVTEN